MLTGTLKVYANRTDLINCHGSVVAAIRQALSGMNETALDAVLNQADQTVELLGPALAQTTCCELRKDAAGTLYFHTEHLKTVVKALHAAKLHESLSISHERGTRK